MNIRPVLPVTLLGSLFSFGCSLPTGLLRSRWAMDHPEYAAKYEDGAEKTDVLGKMKQASDARFVEGSSGLYVSAGTSGWAGGENPMAGAEIGSETYFTSYMTGRMTLLGFANEEDIYVGSDVGMRWQLPSRLAPFVGAGVFGGYAKSEVPSEDDGEDNDEDGFTDESGETDERLSGLIAAMYPEAGVHFWWNPYVRLTGFGRYMLTTDDNDWFAGGGIALFR